MRIIVGHPVRGENFFPRNKVINKIYRQLESGASLYMNAPRRVGKTSIMFNLEDFPRENYHFIYIDASKIDNSEAFFMKLMQELLKSEGVQRFVKASEKTKSIFDAITDKFKKIEGFGFSIEFGDTKQSSYFDVFNDTLLRLNLENFRIVFMIDEFPTTIENIIKKQDEQEAIMFLHRNRSLRQIPRKAINFIYTGSIGLPQLVKKLKKSETVNDITFIDVPPLTIEEAKSLAISLLEKHKIVCESDVLDYLVSKVEWLMPFFIQFMVDELLGIWEDGAETVTYSMIDEAFLKIISSRNYSKFASYVERLEDGLALDGEFDIAKQILCLIATEQTVSKDEILKNQDENAKNRLKNILSSLEYDGYIFEENNQYRFNSPILRMWWLKQVC